MEWSIKFATDITLDFGVAVTFDGGVWGAILPSYMSSSTIDGMNALIKNGVGFELRDFSGIVYSSTDPNISSILGEVYRQLSFFKVSL